MSEGEAKGDGARPGVLVASEQVVRGLGDPDMRLVDLRTAEAFARGHLPGAVHLELEALGTSQGPVENVLIAPAEFGALVESLGISSDTTVVAYDDQWGLAAARLLWALHVHGHTRAAILDGGWDLWIEEERPVTQVVVAPMRGRFEPMMVPEVSATRRWLAEKLDDSDVALLDTRTRGEFIQGHIPGAQSWDWFNAVPPGSWGAARDVDELRREWAGLGVEPTKDVVVYCRSGMRAAHTYMALRHAGYERVRLYDGSWLEWSTSGGESNGV